MLSNVDNDDGLRSALGELESSDPLERAGMMQRDALGNIRGTRGTPLDDTEVARSWIQSDDPEIAHAAGLDMMCVFNDTPHSVTIWWEKGRFVDEMQDDGIEEGNKQARQMVGPWRRSKSIHSNRAFHHICVQFIPGPEGDDEKPKVDEESSFDLYVGKHPICNPMALIKPTLRLSDIVNPVTPTTSTTTPPYDQIIEVAPEPPGPPKYSENEGVLYSGCIHNDTPDVVFGWFETAAQHHARMTKWNPAPKNAYKLNPGDTSDEKEFSVFDLEHHLCVRYKPKSTPEKMIKKCVLVDMKGEHEANPEMDVMYKHLVSDIIGEDKHPHSNAPKKSTKSGPGEDLIAPQPQEEDDEEQGEDEGEEEGDGWETVRDSTQQEDDRIPRKTTEVAADFEKSMESGGGIASKEELNKVMYHLYDSAETEKERLEMEKANPILRDRRPKPVQVPSVNALYAGPTTASPDEVPGYTVPYLRPSTKPVSYKDLINAAYQDNKRKEDDQRLIGTQFNRNAYSDDLERAKAKRKALIRNQGNPEYKSGPRTSREFQAGWDLAQRNKRVEFFIPDVLLYLALTFAFMVFCKFQSFKKPVQGLQIPLLRV